MDHALPGVINGIDLATLSDVVAAIRSDPATARVGFRVTTHWSGRTRSESVIEAYEMAGERIEGASRSLQTSPKSCWARTAPLTRRNC